MGINYIKDIVNEEGNLKSLKELERETKQTINFVKLYSLWTVIPKQWKRWLKEDSCSDTSSNEPEIKRSLQNPKKVNWLYRTLTRDELTLVEYGFRWRTELLQIFLEDLLKVSLRLTKITICVKLCSFQYKILFTPARQDKTIIEFEYRALFSRTPHW